MGSTLIYKAMAQGDGRFEICRRIARGVRITHLKGDRLSESIAVVLKGFSVEPIPFSDATRTVDSSAELSAPMQALLPGSC